MKILPPLPRTALLCLLLFVPLAARGAVEIGKSPTAKEWEPVKELVIARAPDAIEKVSAITRRYPEWASGFVNLAVLLHEADRQEEALAAARRARELDGEDHAAARILLQVLLKQEQYPAVLEAFAAWGGRRDRDGMLHYLAAQANTQLGNAEAGHRQLDEAMRLLQEYSEYLAGLQGDEGAAEKERVIKLRKAYHFFRGRQLQKAGDLKGAIASFKMGLERSAEFADHWYNLGVLQRALAYDDDPVDLRLLKTAQESLRVAAEFQGDDPAVQFSLGIVCLGLGGGDDEAAKAENQAAERLLANAIDGFRAAGETDSMRVARAEACLGLAILRDTEDEGEGAYQRYETAVAHLKLAEALGRRHEDGWPSLQRSVYNNMMSAIIGAEKLAPTEVDRRQWQKESDRLLPEDGELLVDPAMMMVKYYDRAVKLQEADPATAISRANRALEMSKHVDADRLDGDTRKRFLRYVGHVHALKADCQAALIRAGEGDQEALATDLELATRHYREAARAGSFGARDDYLHRMVQRGPVEAFDGGWQYLRWKGFLSLTGLATMVKYYGAAKAWQRPVHLVVWGVILLALFALFVKGFFFPGTLPEDDGRRRSRPAKPGTGERRPVADERSRRNPADERPRQAPPPAAERPRRDPPAERPRQATPPAARPAPPRAAGPQAQATRRSDGEVEETVAVTAPKPQRKAAPGLSNRGAIDVVQRRIARQNEEQADNGRRPPPRRRR